MFKHNEVKTLEMQDRLLQDCAEVDAFSNSHKAQPQSSTHTVLQANWHLPDCLTVRLAVAQQLHDPQACLC
jgi:hypothetical protein